MVYSSRGNGVETKGATTEREIERGWRCKYSNWALGLGCESQCCKIRIIKITEGWRHSSVARGPGFDPHPVLSCLEIEGKQYPKMDPGQEDNQMWSEGRMGGTRVFPKRHEDLAMYVLCKPER